MSEFMAFKLHLRVPAMAQWVKILIAGTCVPVEAWVQSTAGGSGLKNLALSHLWLRLNPWHRTYTCYRCS